MLQLVHRDREDRGGRFTSDNWQGRCVMAARTWTETIKVTGTQLVEAMKKILHEGNVRRVIIKQGDHTVAEFPLAVGVIGAVMAPILAAIGALAAVLNECTIEVERSADSDPTETAGGPDL
jgi:hypothetical protein